MVRWVLALAVAGGIALCGLVVLAGLRLSAPARSVIGSPPADLPGARSVVFGDDIHGWFVPATSPGGGVVILAHGVWSNRRSMVARARVLGREGFSTLLIDLQAHGESGGSRITFGAKEASGVAAAVRFARQERPGERVGVIGTSLGGAAAVLGPAPLPVDALVLESVYPTIEAALSHRLVAALGPVLGPVAAPILTPLFDILLPPILRVAPGDLRPIDRIGTVTAPVLVASGTVDDRTPLTEARALYDQAPQPKQFWAVEGAAHVDLERYDPAQYWAVVLPFLNRTLRP